MKATGMEKGGIYGHFNSKKEIALAAFEYNASRVFNAFIVSSFYNKSTIEMFSSLNSKSAIDMLHILFSYYEKLYDGSYLSGGCPLLNTATEADDTDSELMFGVKKYVDIFRKVIVTIVKLGIKNNEIRSDVDPEEFAITCIEILEGGNFMVKVYNDKSYRTKAIARIKTIIDSELVR
jgi:TetR/AcrR family transcriptional repressor of nem operon